MPSLGLLPPSVAAAAARSPRQSAACRIAAARRWRTFYNGPVQPVPQSFLVRRRHPLPARLLRRRSAEPVRLGPFVLQTVAMLVCIGVGLFIALGGHFVRWEPDILGPLSVAVIAVLTPVIAVALYLRRPTREQIKAGRFGHTVFLVLGVPFGALVVACCTTLAPLGWYASYVRVFGKTEYVQPATLVSVEPRKSAKGCRIYGKLLVGTNQTTVCLSYFHGGPDLRPGQALVLSGHKTSGAFYIETLRPRPAEWLPASANAPAQ